PPHSFTLSLHDALPIFFRFFSLTLSARQPNSWRFSSKKAGFASKEPGARGPGVGGFLWQDHSCGPKEPSSGKDRHYGKTIGKSLDRKSTRLNSSHVSIS